MIWKITWSIGPFRASWNLPSIMSLVTLSSSTFLPCLRHVGLAATQPAKKAGPHPSAYFVRARVRSKVKKGLSQPCFVPFIQERLAALPSPQ